MNISTDLQQVGFVMNNNRFIPATEQGAVRSFEPVVPLGVDPIHVPHDPSKICSRGFNEQMVVVRQ